MLRNRMFNDFASVFLCPVLLNYYSLLSDEYPNNSLIFLAREGWILQRFHTRASTSLELQIPCSHSHYFKVSRTLLFRALSNDPYAWDLATSSEFKGTFSDLLKNRFGLRNEPELQRLPADLLQTSIRLPRDRDLVLSSISPYYDLLGQITQETRQGLLAYLKSVQVETEGRKWLFVDIGYAGTIQKLVTHIIKQDTEGLYLIATKAGDHQVGEHTASMRGIIKENVAWAQGYQMLDRSLILETLMTAPHGQVVDIRQDSKGEIHFYYGRQAPTQIHAQDLIAIADGAIDAAIEQIQNGVIFTPQEVEAIYTTFVTQPGAIPQSVRHLFGIDDDFSGNGVFNPLHHFGL